MVEIATDGCRHAVVFLRDGPIAALTPRTG
jgi:hypothetical protein